MQFRSLRTHLKSAVRVLALTAFFFGAVHVGAYAMDSSLVCYERKTSQSFLAMSGFAYVGTFTTARHEVFQLYSRRDGAWIMLGITTELEACVLMSGEHHIIPKWREL